MEAFPCERAPLRLSGIEHEHPSTVDIQPTATNSQKKKSDKNKNYKDSVATIGGGVQTITYSNDDARIFAAAFNRRRKNVACLMSSNGWKLMTDPRNRRANRPTTDKVDVVDGWTEGWGWWGWNQV